MFLRKLQMAGASEPVKQMLHQISEVAYLYFDPPLSIFEIQQTVFFLASPRKILFRRPLSLMVF